MSGCGANENDRLYVVTGQSLALLRIRLQKPQRLLSVSEDGHLWQINDDTYQLLAPPIILWRFGLVVPLVNAGERQWFWLWWFQLSVAQLAQLRCLSLVAGQISARR